MAKKISGWKTKGMNRDLSVSAFNPEFAYENINLRLSTNEGNTLMSWVNEKGTAQIDTDVGISGVPIGTAVINHKLVLFTTEHTEKDGHGDFIMEGDDHIYVLEYQDEDKTFMKNTEKCSMNLGFDSDHPLETLVSYESESVQKVYWVDGKNQPRLINICNDVSQVVPTYFDFVPTLQLNEDVVVEKVLGGNGMFAPGVI